jgi:hypothetical protein
LSFAHADLRIGDLIKVMKKRSGSKSGGAPESQHAGQAPVTVARVNLDLT